MPQSGDVVVSGAEEKDGPWSLFVFSLKDGNLIRKEISSSCAHNNIAFLSSLIIHRREKLVVSCSGCDDLKWLNLQTGRWRKAFRGCQPFNMYSGGSDTIFVQSRLGRSILQLNGSTYVFQGPIRTLYTDMQVMGTCYIPSPVDALVISDWYSSKMVALSVKNNKVIWEFQEKKVEINMENEYQGEQTRENNEQQGNGNDKVNASKTVVWDRVGLLFHPNHNVLIVADGDNERVLIINPGDGSLIQTPDLPDMGAVFALELYKDEIVMLHFDGFKLKISYLNLSG